MACIAARTSSIHASVTYDPSQSGHLSERETTVNSKLIAARLALSSSISLFTLPVLADDGQYVVSFYKYYSPGSTSFSAQQGADYILYADGYGTVSIVNPSGGRSPVLNPNGNALEAQFRANYSASYAIVVQTSYHA